MLASYNIGCKVARLHNSCIHSVTYHSWCKIAPFTQSCIMLSEILVSRPQIQMWLHQTAAARNIHTYIFVYYTEWQNSSAQDQNTSKKIRIKLSNYRIGRNTSRPSVPVPCHHNVLTARLNKKAQLSLTNPRDAKACQNCSNLTCLQRCRWQYWHIFMRLTAVASEIPRNSLKMQTYGFQGHPRSSILVPIESPYVTCY